MDVKVEHRLIALAAIGLQQGESGRVERCLDGTGHALCGLHDGSGLLGGDVQQRSGVAFCGHQYMTRIHLTEIHEGNGQRVFVHPGAGNLACDQTAKDALTGR